MIKQTVTISRAALMEIYARVNNLDTLCSHIEDEDLQEAAETHLLAIDTIIADALGTTPYDLMNPSLGAPARQMAGRQE